MNRNLADELAIQRTQLANERTWLAYLRTALTLFVAGVSFIQFFSTVSIRVIGWMFIPLGVMTTLLGYQRYRRSTRLIREISMNAGHPSQPQPR